MIYFCYRWTLQFSSCQHANWSCLMLFSSVSTNVIAYAPSVSWTWSAHLRLISNKLSLVTATVNVLWGNWFKKLELFKVNVLWCFIPILCEFVRIVFKDHSVQSLWAATSQVNSHLVANKYGLGKSETKHLPEIQSLVKKPQACVREVHLESNRKIHHFALQNPLHLKLCLKIHFWTLLGFSYWKAMSFSQASESHPSQANEFFFTLEDSSLSLCPFSFSCNFKSEAMDGQDICCLSLGLCEGWCSPSSSTHYWWNEWAEQFFIWSSVSQYSEDPVHHRILKFWIVPTFSGKIKHILKFWILLLLLWFLVLKN